MRQSDPLGQNSISLGSSSTRNAKPSTRRVLAHKPRPSGYVKAEPRATRANRPDPKLRFVVEPEIHRGERRAYRCIPAGSTPG
jgi:hypothetical protein